MVTIVDYRIGNIGSILNMLKRIGVAGRVSADPAEIAQASRLILPGVGAFDAAMIKLRGSGLIEVLDRTVRGAGVPLLGVCLGMQLLTRSSEEGSEPGLGWIAASTKRFAFADSRCALKIPHMGWNQVRLPRPSALFAGLESEARFYFVHSYYVACEDPKIAVAEAEYGGQFCCAFVQGNICGVQFHPEKSHRFGMQLLKNFVERGAA